MKDQVIIAPSGHLCIAVPLFRMEAGDEVAAFSGYFISFTNTRPVAYVIDVGPEVGRPWLVNAKFAESRFEFLGEL